MCPGAWRQSSRTPERRWGWAATPIVQYRATATTCSSEGVPPISTWIARILSRNALLVVLALLIVTFTLLLPHTFPTAFNFRLLSSEKSVVALLALAVLVPLSANHYDLSVGSVLGLVAIITIGFQVNSGMPWKLAVALAITAAAFVGAINGLLVTRFRVGSFIATLGVGTVVYGVGLWYTGGEQVNGNLPNEFLQIASPLFGMPLPAIIALVVATLMWLLYSFFPIGRYLYIIGDNPRAAELIGIPVKRYTFPRLCRFRSPDRAQWRHSGCGAASRAERRRSRILVARVRRRAVRRHFDQSRTCQRVGHDLSGAGPCGCGVGARTGGRSGLCRADVQRRHARHRGRNRSPCNRAERRRHQGRQAFPGRPTRHQ